MKIKLRRRLTSIILALLMIISLIPSGLVMPESKAHAADITTQATSSTDYGLVDNIQDGTVLHCFNWKYTDIIAELPNIAAAGFTTVQTSPAQVGAGTGAWYWLYQPLGFYVGSNGIGTEAELKTLCTEAHKYGMKVIVDVVANHLAGNHSSIQNDLKGSEYWHYYGSQIDYKNRYAVVNGDIGMQDLKSENSYVQQVVANYIKSLKNDGVDGIRWDAAKHIALPSEGCNFWPAVTSEGLFNYGEILVGPTDDEQNNNNTPLMQEYTNYMTVTDSIYGKTLREAFKNGNITSSIGNWSERGVSKSKLIYWAESHDTYSNNGEYGEDSRTSNQNQIDRAYAILAAQANAMTLYFSRPFETIKNNIKIGVKGSTAFKSDEIAAVNHFHNAMIGQKEYYTTGDNCAVVCREQGAVVVKGIGSGDVTVPNGGGTTAPGTYVDQVSGSTWTVTSTTISGTIGSSGIAVIYNPGPVVTEPTASITPGSQNYSTDSISLTLNFKNATSGSYSIDNGTYKTFTNGQTITIGTGLAYGTSTKVSVKATDGTTTSTPVSYTYTKTETVENTAYLKLPAGWGTDVYCYAYDSATELVNNGIWPGKKMTLDASTGYYKYVVPDTIKAPRVIFYNSSANRTPVNMVKGYLFETDGSWLYADGTWAKYQPVATGTVKVNYLDESGTSIATAKTLTGTVGETYTTTAVAVEGYTLKSTPTNASGKYTSGTITLNYVYSVVTDDLELNFGADKSSPQTAGTALTLNGIAEGGKAPYTYKYYVNGSLVGTKLGSGATSVAWTPSAGNYVIKCEVTDAENTVTTSTKNYTIESSGTTALNANLTVNNSTSTVNVSVGDLVTLKASASGGSGSYTYTYKAYDGSKWLTLKSNTTSITYTTVAEISGNMRYVVVVKDSTGKTVDSNKITVTIIDKALASTLKINNLTSNQTVNSGSSIILTTSASGGSGSYTYTYKAYNGNKWLTLKSNTTSTTYTTTAGTSGSMKYVVVVKDSTGKTVDSNKITVTIIDKELVGTLKINDLTSNQTVRAGSSIILKASATGGNENYTYTYKAYNGSKWLTLKSNTTSTSYTTTAGTSGSMKYVVVVTDSTGKTVDSNKITVTIMDKELAGTIKINNSSYNAIMAVGSTITIAINAEGGSGSYTYTYKAYNGEKWITLKSATSSTSYTCKITATMKYVVVVKDSTGKTVDSNKIQIIV